MRDSIVWFVKSYLRWVLIFIIVRFIFMFYMLRETLEYDVMTLAESFYNGLQHDFSLGGYIMGLNSLIVLFGFMFNWKKATLYRVMKPINMVLLVIVSLVSAIDMELFRNWGRHLDNTPLAYLNTPGAMIASTSGGRIAIVLGIAAVIGVVGYFILRSAFKVPRNATNRYISMSRRVVRCSLQLIIMGLIIIPIRGGFSKAPMNCGTVYFHKDQYPNLLATNGTWYFIYSLTKMKRDKISYPFMTTEKAEETVAPLFAQTDIADTEMVLNTTRPNIIFIILEGISAKAIGAFGGETDFMPNMSALAREGIRFSRIYSSAERSARGITGILSSCPALPRTTLIKYPHKSVKLPSLSRELIKLGYDATFYHGGNLNFSSMRGYFINSGFTSLEDDTEIDSSLPRGEWGIQDREMLEYLFSGVDKQFSSNSESRHLNMFFTLSTHLPYDVEEEVYYKGTDDKSKYINSLMYTDKYFGEFIEKAKKSSWWDNTLIVITGDHGNRLPYFYKYQVPKAFAIPTIFAGGAVKKGGMVLDDVGSNIDLTPTLLRQFGVDDISKFKFGKDLFNKKSKSYAFYTSTISLGFVSDSINQMYNLESNRYLQNEDLRIGQDTLPVGKAYLQLVAEYSHNL